MITTLLAQGDPPESFTPPIGPLGKPLGYTFDKQTSLGGRLSTVISNIIGVVTMVAGFAFLIYFIVATVQLITSAGDAQKIQTARTMMTNALIGIFISAAAYPIASLLSNLLGIPLTKPTDLFSEYMIFSN
ncbi:MAG: hypothetical protein U9Q63_00390 [Patescibacteria group bacterium]|nr:hypothetical protein [Patescibacteria group bacterium]